MLRYALKRQAWNPYDLAPVEFVELNFDFHPDYIEQELKTAGFATQSRVPVSFFRLNVLKERVPTNLLVGLDGVMQRSGLLYSPSVFAKNVAEGETANNLSAETIFVCPDTGGELKREGDVLTSQANGLRWAIRDGIYDFKAPLD
jgi:hypothetical protein